MGFIGAQLASVPLTASDITNDIINADKIADDSISEEHIDNTAITGHSAITSLADTDKFLVSDASDSGNLKYVESQYIGGGLDNWSENSGNLLPSNASYGIYLGVNSATAANLLDDFEVGTWTPRLQGRSTAGTFNYDSGGGDGYYKKTGDIVTVWFWLSGSLSGASGELQISGLPFNMDGGQTQYREYVGAQNFDGRNPAFMSKFNSTTWELYEFDGSQDGTNISQSNSNTSDPGSGSVQMWGSMTYKTS